MDEHASPDGGPEGALTTEVGHEEHKGGMPQLDFSTYVPQLAWLALSFLILYVVMARIALPRIGSVLETRRAKISGDLDAAERLKKEADQALAAYEASLAKARERAHQLAAETNKKLKDDTDALRARVEAELAQKTKDAEAKIHAAKSAALANLKAVAVDVTTLVASKLLGEPVDAGAIAKSVEAEMAGVQGASGSKAA